MALNEIQRQTVDYVNPVIESLLEKLPLSVVCEKLLKEEIMA